MFVGDVTEYLASYAKNHFADAVLVDKTNYQQCNQYEVAYTSIGDLRNDNEFWFVLQNFDIIIYVPPDYWKDTLNKNNIFNGIQTLTEYLLMKINKERQNVIGLDDKQYYTENYTALTDKRKTDNNQFWFAGCSFTVGKGVQPEQNYGSLISNHYNKPASFLASVGSSISWAADQILRSDIKANDLVVWGLTEHQRFAHWGQDNQVHHLNSSSVQRIDQKNFDLHKDVLLRMITSDSLLYEAVIHVHQVVNYCNKIGADLLIVGLLSNPELEFALQNVDEFVQYSHRESHITLYNWKDLGTDNVHPGPAQHKMFAEFCINQIDRRDLIRS